MVGIKLRDISVKYGVNPSWFNCYDLDKHEYQKIVSLFSNPWVEERLMTAKSEVFSREDITQKVQRTSLDRLSFTIKVMSQFVCEHFNYEDDLSVIRSYTDMWEELQSYDRKEKATDSSKRINSELKKVLDSFKPKLIECEMYPFVYGSVRYGDAQGNSDIDMKLLVNDTEKKQRELYSDLEIEINEKIRYNQWSDDLSFEESVIEIPEMTAVLRDVIDKEVTSIVDYRYKKVNFYPYNWILEGNCPVKGLGKIEKDVKELKGMINQAIHTDPLFELMMSLRLHRSIQRRKDKLMM